MHKRFKTFDREEKSKLLLNLVDIIKQPFLSIAACGFACAGHHELPPVAHTTMLRDFPNSLQRYRDAVIPPRPSGTPVSWAANHHQHYVSQDLA